MSWFDWWSPAHKPAHKPLTVHAHEQMACLGKKTTDYFRLSDGTELVRCCSPAGLETWFDYVTGRQYHNAQNNRKIGVVIRWWRDKEEADEAFKRAESWRKAREREALRKLRSLAKQEVVEVNEVEETPR